MDEEEVDKQHKLRLLEALRSASKDLQTIPIPIYSNNNLAAIKTFLELGIQLNSIFSAHPTLLNLPTLLSSLETQFNKLQASQDYSLRSFIYRQIANYEVSKIASSIEVEVRSSIDQESIKNLVQVLQDPNVPDDEEKVRALVQFQNRLSSGFDSYLQEIVLKARVFSVLESVVTESKYSERVRNQSARAMVALANFNKDVFVGLVLMGPMIEAMVSMDSCDSIQVLTLLIKLIKSPLVYELDESGYIPKVISFLSSEDRSIQVAAMECILELACFARKEAIKAMLEGGLVKKLVELQRVEITSDSHEIDESDNGETRGFVKETESEMKMESKNRRLVENCLFTSCSTRFVGKLEMGEGLEKEEKRELKQELLRRIREASISEAEATSIVTEVLWGSSPLLN